MTEVRRSLLAYTLAIAACAALLVVVFELWRADPHVPLSYRPRLGLHAALGQGDRRERLVPQEPPARRPVRHGDARLPARREPPLRPRARDRPGDERLVPRRQPLLLRHVLPDDGDHPGGAPPARRAAGAGGRLRRCSTRSCRITSSAGERHLFLSSYFLVPPAVLICLWIYRDGALFFRERDDGRARLDLRSGRALAALAICRPARLGRGLLRVLHLLSAAGRPASAPPRRGGESTRWVGRDRDGGDRGRGRGESGAEGRLRVEARAEPGGSPPRAGTGGDRRTEDRPAPDAHPRAPDRRSRAAPRTVRQDADQPFPRERRHARRRRWPGLPGAARGRLRAKERAGRARAGRRPGGPEPRRTAPGDDRRLRGRSSATSSAR